MDIEQINKDLSEIRESIRNIAKNKYHLEQELEMVSRHCREWDNRIFDEYNGTPPAWARRMANRQREELEVLRIFRTIKGASNDRP